MQQEMQQLAADFKAQTSYVEPELLRIGLATQSQVDLTQTPPRFRRLRRELDGFFRQCARTVDIAQMKVPPGHFRQRRSAVRLQLESVL